MSFLDIMNLFLHGLAILIPLVILLIHSFLAALQKDGVASMQQIRVIPYSKMERHTIHSKIVIALKL